jgi:hypothetical protein
MIMKTRRTFVASIAGMIAALLIAAVAIAQTTEAGADNHQEKLLGSWNVEVTAVVQNVTFPALLTFTSDGNVIADEPPSPFETSGHGNWIKRGHREIAYTFVALVGSAEGPLTAKIKVVGTLQFDPSQGKWNGPFKADLTDPNGQPIFSEHGTFSLTRIAIERID